MSFTQQKEDRKIDPNNPNVKHDDIIIDTWGGKVNVSKSARKKITK